MRRHLLTRTAVLGSLLVLAACEDADTLAGNDTSELVTTASAELSAPNTKRGNDKALLFRVPRETRVLLLAGP